MCRAPKPPKPKAPEKPEFLRNPFLDAAISGSGVVDQLRTGRSSLRIPLGGPSTAGAQPAGVPLPSVNTNMTLPGGGGGNPTGRVPNPFTSNLMGGRLRPIRMGR